MTAEMQIALWGAATAIPLTLNMLTKRDSDAIGLSAMVVLIWLLGRVFSSLWEVPEAMQWYPVIDGLAGATAFSAWLSRPTPWKLLLTGLYVGQITAALAFWLAWPQDGSLLFYLRANNLLYALQLLCVLSPGGVHAARVFVRMLPRWPRPFRHARLGPWP